MKCDFCEKPAIAYGAAMSYQACDSHVDLGEKIESKMFDEMEPREEILDINSPEFLRTT
jgi:hypothetical protein